MYPRSWTKKGKGSSLIWNRLSQIWRSTYDDTISLSTTYFYGTDMGQDIQGEDTFWRLF
jgi:hypothetical protein